MITPLDKLYYRHVQQRFGNFLMQLISQFCCESGCIKRVCYLIFLRGPPSGKFTLISGFIVSQ